MDKEHFMNIALEEARKSSWPFGAVIVIDGRVVSQAGSGDGADIGFDPTAHAEVNAIRRACARLGRSDLSDAVLFASCEPCALCLGAAWYASIGEIVYGTSLKDIKEISKHWGGDLAFPHDHIRETEITLTEGPLKEEIMAMYLSHPRINSHV